MLPNYNTSAAIFPQYILSSQARPRSIPQARNAVLSSHLPSPGVATFWLPLPPPTAHKFSHHRPHRWLPVPLFLLREAFVSGTRCVARPPGLKGWGATLQSAGTPLLGSHTPDCHLWSVGAWRVERGTWAFFLSLSCPPSFPATGCQWPSLCFSRAKVTTESPRSPCDPSKP